MVYVKMVNSTSKMFQDFGILIIRRDANLCSVIELAFVEVILMQSEHKVCLAQR